MGMTFDDDTFSVSSAAKLCCEELHALQIAITCERDVAELDLTQARTKLFTEGVRADPVWFRTTEALVRRKKRQLQWINNRVAEIRRSERQSETGSAFLENFYQAAKARLSPGLLHDLEAEARYCGNGASSRPPPPRSSRSPR